MKKILITGKGSYIGTHVKAYLDTFTRDYIVDELDMLDVAWESFDFTDYDVVYHVAGIAHIKETKENEHLYYTVNRDLAVQVAEKAKCAGVKQFIFMSSMSVYGMNISDKPLTVETKCNPNTFYGISKFQAEEKLMQMQSQEFRVCILRPPMVYGEDSPGNLSKLFRAVRKIHLFPTIKNQRSSITVHKLAEMIKFYVDSEAEGIFLPQNDDYMCTYQIVKEKMEAENVKVIYISLFNPIIRLLIGKIDIVTKCFGDLIYEK